MKAYLILYFLILPFSGFSQVEDAAFSTFINAGSGTVNIYYYDAEPFIYKNEIGELKGIEKDILESFFKFVEKKYQLRIFKNWIQVGEFDSLFKSVSQEKNAFGISLISKTEKRGRSVAFSNAYMPDVSVFISHISVPFIKDTSQLSLVTDFKAATISNTTYEGDLLKLSAAYDLNFKLLNVVSEEDIVRLVSLNREMVGYVGLPFYVIEIGKGNPVKRQGNFQIKRDGYRFIFNKFGGWDEPIQEYFESYLYKAQADNIIRAYLGNDYSELIWGIAGSGPNGSNDTEIVFLNKEKELQSKSLFQSQKDKEDQQSIIIGVSISFFFVIIIVLLLVNNNKRKGRVNLMLVEKSEELELLLSQLNMQKDEIAYQRTLLQQKNKQLQNINKQKDDLIGLVAHDLKSPINQMSGLISLLGYKNETWEDDEKLLYEKLAGANSHLKELVERILDLEAIGENILNYKIEKVNMSAILIEVLQDFEEVAIHKQIKIDRSELAPEVLVSVDSFFLKQVFENLISNALKFSPMGKTVKVRSERIDSFQHIQIVDEGPGITEGDKTKLFTKFQTLSAKPTGSESSTGLGLSIVKKYVDEMNGSVWVESEHGKGATFIVAFKSI